MKVSCKDFLRITSLTQYPAISAVQQMARAPDFDRNLLLLATQLSHESHMKTLLLSTLEALLQTLKTQENSDTIGETITLTRCIIRLVQTLLAEPASNQCVELSLLTSSPPKVDFFWGAL
jgi:hypothetical protein